MMHPPIFRTCVRSAAVVALLGSKPTRLYPFGEAPENVQLPYAVWQIIGGAPEHFLAGSPDIDSYALQVDVYATSAAIARAVGRALRDAIETEACITRWGGEMREPNTRDYRLSFDLDWWTPRKP